MLTKIRRLSQEYAKFDVDVRKEIDQRIQHPDTSDDESEEPPNILHVEDLPANTFNLLTGMDKNYFFTAYKVVKNEMEENRKISYIKPEDRFLYTLMYLHRGDHFRKLAPDIGIYRTTVNEIVRDTINRCYKKLGSKYIKMISLDDPEYSRFASTQYPTLLGSIDATIIPVGRPRTNARKLYSGKHKLHGFKFQVMVSPTGKCIYIT